MVYGNKGYDLLRYTIILKVSLYRSFSQSVSHTDSNQKFWVTRGVALDRSLAVPGVDDLHRHAGVGLGSLSETIANRLGERWRFGLTRRTLDQNGYDRSSVGEDVDEFGLDVVFDGCGLIGTDGDAREHDREDRPLGGTGTETIASNSRWPIASVTAYSIPSRSSVSRTRSYFPRGTNT